MESNRIELLAVFLCVFFMELSELQIADIVFQIISGIFKDKICDRINGFFLINAIDRKSVV